MLMLQRRTAALLMLASLSLAPGCAGNPRPLPVHQSFPNAADLKAPAKPLLTVEALTSEKGLNDFDAAMEAWGDTQSRQIDRLCRWAAALGMQIDCPAAPPSR